MPLEQSPPVPATSPSRRPRARIKPACGHRNRAPQDQTNAQGLDYGSLGGNRALQQLANPFARATSLREAGLFGHFRSKPAPPSGAEAPPANVAAPAPGTAPAPAPAAGTPAGAAAAPANESVPPATPGAPRPGRAATSPAAQGTAPGGAAAPTATPGTTPPSTAPGAAAAPPRQRGQRPDRPRHPRRTSSATQPGPPGPGFGGTLGADPYSVRHDRRPQPAHDSRSISHHVGRRATRPAQAPNSARRLANLSLRAQFQILGKPVAQATGPRVFQFQLLQQYE